MPATNDAITLKQFLALPEDGYRDEVSRGMLVREPQPGDQHGRITVELSYLLRHYLDEHPVGGLRAASGFLLSREPLTIRGPDVAFISSDRLRNATADPFFDGAPDLAIEIVSPSNTAADLQEKITEYFQAGAQLVWVVYPRTRSVAVHEATGEIHILSSSATLTAPLQLPGFEVLVATLFD